MCDYRIFVRFHFMLLGEWYIATVASVLTATVVVWKGRGSTRHLALSVNPLDDSVRPRATYDPSQERVEGPFETLRELGQ